MLSFRHYINYLTSTFLGLIMCIPMKVQLPPDPRPVSFMASIIDDAGSEVGIILINYSNKGILIYKEMDSYIRIDAQLVRNYTEAQIIDLHNNNWHLAIPNIEDDLLRAVWTQKAEMAGLL